MNTQNTGKKVCTCALCKKVMFLKNNSNKIKTTTLCVLILKALKEIKPEKEFFSMRQDIYDFVGEHWNCVKGFSIFSKPNWKKMLLDTFNHCTNIETGKNYGLRASFRIKNKQEETKSETAEHTGKINDSSDISSRENTQKGNGSAVVEKMVEDVANTPLPQIDNHTQYVEESPVLLQEYYTQLSHLRMMLYNNIAITKQCQGVIGNGTVIPNWQLHCESMKQNAAVISFIMNGLTQTC